MIGPAELLVVLILVVPWLFAVLDILKSEFTGSNKLVWLLVATFAPIIGPLLYLLLGRKQKARAPSA